MYEVLFQAHSGLRFIVFFALIIALILAFAGWFGGKEFTKTNRIFNLVTMISTHLQALFGIFLYFVSPLAQYNNMGEAMKNSTLRYWTVEHLVMMLLAVVLITIGNSKSKKLLNASAKHRAVAIYFGLGLIVILAAIVQSGRPLLGISH